jgi:hypothetical protein
VSKDFVPASSLAPVPGSSYSVRLGKIDDKWAIRVYRGQQILTTEIIGELDPNIMVTVVQSAISLPSYSPYHIVRAVSPLIREARSGYVPPVREGSAEVAPRPAVYSNAAVTQSASTPTTQESRQSVQEPTIEPDVQQSATPTAQKAPLREATSVGTDQT